MALITDAKQLRNLCMVLWLVVVSLVYYFSLSTQSVESRRIMRSEIHLRDGSSEFLWFLVAVVGLFFIWVTHWQTCRFLYRSFQPFARWADDVSQQKSDAPLPRLIGNSRNSDRLPPSPEELTVKLRSAIQLLEFRYQHLLEERSRTADALRGMQEGFLALDADLELLLINEAGRDLLEMTGPVRVGKPLVELIRQPNILQLVRETHRTGKSSESVQQIGHVRPRQLRLRVSPLAEPDGTMRTDSKHGVLLLVSDVTRLTKLESMRRDFTANVSHELKTPLAAIQAYAETLLIGALDDPEANQRFVEGIAKQAERLSALIHDLLHLAKLDAEPEKITLDAVELRDLVQEIAHEHHSIASSKQVDLVVKLGDVSTYVWGDREAVRAVTGNLLSNAIRYNRERGTVTVTLQSGPKWTTLKVADTGVGIAAEEHDRIFERFYRVDKARSIDVGGTGLGLAIVKNLVQQMNGSVELQSEVGKGSTFEIKFHTHREGQRPPNAIDRGYAAN